MKASAQFHSFASAKFALRAFSQSLAKEFGPQGLHVGHVVADGVFDSERGRSFSSNVEGLMDTDEMAESYWKMHTQGRRAWSWEIDLRPYLVLSLNPTINVYRRSGRVYRANPVWTVSIDIVLLFAILQV